MGDRTKGVNLGGYEFNEDSVVDPKLVPLVRGAVCEFCTEKGVGGCKVTWHLNSNKVTFRCAFCVEKRQGCSFRDSQWGISTPPTIFKIKKGTTRREEHGARGRLSSAKNKPGRSALSTRLKRGKSVESTVSRVSSPESSRGAKKISSKSTTAANKAEATHSIPDHESLGDRQEVVFFESLDPYAEVLRQTALDSFALRGAISKVRAAIIREEGGLAIVRSLVDSRAVMMNELLDRLELRMKVSLQAEAEAEKVLAVD